MGVEKRELSMENKKGFARQIVNRAVIFSLDKVLAPVFTAWTLQIPGTSYWTVKISKEEDLSMSQLPRDQFDQASKLLKQGKITTQNVARDYIIPSLNRLLGSSNGNGHERGDQNGFKGR